MTAATAASTSAPQVPLCAYLLADHLDAVLAAGEDLIAAGRNRTALVKGSDAELRAARAAEREMVERIRGLEAATVAHVLKAREHAEDLAWKDARFRLVADLFVSGTACVPDAVADLSDTTAADFESGDVISAYLRERGLDAEAPTPAGGAEAPGFGDDFILVERIRLGVLLDLVATFLDTLELHFELFAPDGEPRSAEPDAGSGSGSDPVAAA